MDLDERIGEAIKTISKASFVRLVSHHDADGIASCSILCKALLRKRIKFHATCNPSLDSELMSRLRKENNALIVFSDMGSGQLDEIESLDSDAIVLDHHRTGSDSDKVVHVNANMLGIDGTYECCASTLAFVVAKGMDEKNWDLVGLFVSGLLGDRQHIGGIKGLNREIVEEGIRRGMIKTEIELNLSGMSIFDALYTSIDPYFKGLSGREEDVKKILEEIGVDSGADISELGRREKNRLCSFLIIKLLRQDVRPEFIEEFITERFYLVREGMYADDLTGLINSSGRLGKAGLGVLIALGSKKLIDDAWKLRYKYKEKVLKGLMKLEDGIIERKNIQYFFCDEPKIAGSLAGLGMCYLFEHEKPTIAFSEVRGKIKVSSRGTAYLISKGLDLARALSEASKPFNGDGGGHPVAAGATIPKGREEEFLELLDRIVGEQLGKG